MIVDELRKYEILDIPAQEKLKACPFCGADKDELTLRKYLNMYESDFAIRCLACGCESPVANSEKNAFLVWNERSEQDESS